MEVIIILYYVFAIFFIVNTIRKNFITPSLLFVMMQILMFTGIIMYANFENEADTKLIIIYFISLILFILGTLMANSIKRKKGTKTIFHKKQTEITKNQKMIIIAITLLSVIICSFFFLKAGYNVFVMIFKSLNTSSVDNYTDSRIAFNNISGVGYIYQFRVILLPLLTAYLISLKEQSKLKKTGIILLPIMTMFLLGTGQRGGFVIFILTCIVALLYIYKIYGDKKIKKTLLAIIGVSIALFSIMTLFNGRVGSDGSVANAVIKRALNDNQESAVIAFRYIDTQPTQYGRDWLLSLKDILPGKNNYTQLAYKVFKIMYGSERGTAPPCIWGSTYYNFGIVGILIFPLLLGFFYQKLYISFSKRELNKLTIFLYSALFVILGSWVDETPLYLFNSGFITVYLLKILLLNNRISATSDKKSIIRVAKK